MAESLYNNLVVGKLADAKESVHLESFPVFSEELTDAALEAEMTMIKDIAEAGRNARQTSGVRLRQPLARAIVVTKDVPMHVDEDVQILMDELNVKNLEFCGSEPSDAASMAKVDGKDFTVLMDMTITPELEREGMARDIVRRIQSLRKEMNLQYDRNVKMGIEGDPEVLMAMEEHKEYITHETLATEVVSGPVADATAGDWDILGKKLKVWLLAI
jgi:valyl-tRNA synthetase